VPDEAPGRELADVLSEEEFAGLWAPRGPLHVTQARQYHRLRAEHLQAQAVAAVDDKAERRRWQGAEEAALDYRRERALCPLMWQVSSAGERV